MQSILLTPRAGAVELGPLGGAGNPAAKDDFTPEQVKDLARTIVDNNRGESDLAIDMLVQLAARTGVDGRAAQKVLCDLYADPGVFAEPNTLGDHNKQRIREALASAAHSLCGLSLNARDKQGHAVDHPLSTSVAYLGAQSSESTCSSRADIEKHLNGRLENVLGHDDPDRLGSTRQVDGSELQAASNAYGDRLKLDDRVSIGLDLDKSLTGTDKAGFADAIKGITARLEKSSCKAIWLHTGSKGYPHYMPMVIQRDSAGKLHYHILNTDARSEERNKQIRERLHGLLDNTGAGAGEVHFMHRNMQDRAGHGCGVLGHDLLKQVGQAMADKPELAGSATGISGVITSFCDGWKSLSDEDVKARLVSTRAELFQACEDAPVNQKPFD